MNYIQQVNAFNDYLMYNQLSTTEIALWHALMHVNNKCGWIQEFTVANRTLEQLTGATRPSIARARNSLMQKGLIEYSAQKARQAGAYRVKGLQLFSVQEADTERDSNRTQSDTEPDTDADTVAVPNARPLNKHKQKRKQNKNIYIGDFDSFWSAYPRKDGKAKAKEAFIKLAPNDELFKTMMNAIERQKKGDQWIKEGGKFIPYPATWLNQKRWEDEVKTYPSEKANIKPMLSDIGERKYSQEDWDRILGDPFDVFKKHAGGSNESTL